jgi:hypothetical protein
LLFRAAGLALAAAALTGTPVVAAPSPSSRAAAAGRAGGADRAAIEAARRFLCPHGGRPMRGGRCRGGGGAIASTDPELSVRGWDAGLPAAMRQQSPCPQGTVPARVLLWNDAVRCLPR